MQGSQFATETTCGKGQYLLLHLWQLFKEEADEELSCRKLNFNP